MCNILILKTLKKYEESFVLTTDKYNVFNLFMSVKSELVIKLELRTE